MSEHNPTETNLIHNQNARTRIISLYNDNPFSTSKLLFYFYIFGVTLQTLMAAKQHPQISWCCTVNTQQWQCYLCWLCMRIPTDPEISAHHAQWSWLGRPISVELLSGLSCFWERMLELSRRRTIFSALDSYNSLFYIVVCHFSSMHSKQPKSKKL